MSIYYQDETVTLYHGDAAEVAATLPAGSIQTVVTSPPYFGLRDYGVDGQLGAEKSPAEFIANLVAVFEAIRPALADDGTLWVNLGDSYAASGGHTSNGSNSMVKSQEQRDVRNIPSSNTSGLPLKNLLMIPARFAIAMQDADGWDDYELRADLDERQSAVVYSEICRIKTPNAGENTSANMRSDGARQTPSAMQSAAPGGTLRTKTSSANTAAATTSSTANKRSSATSRETNDATDSSGSTPSTTTARAIPPVPAAGSGDSTSSHSTTSAAEAVSTDASSRSATSTSGSSSSAKATQADTESCATTATGQSATTASARTRTSERLTLPKRDIPAHLLGFFTLKRQNRWVLRNDIIWAKPNGMPESVRDRFSTKHEHVFLFAKKPKYYFNLDPIREPITSTTESALDWDRDGKHTLVPGQKPQHRPKREPTRKHRATPDGVMPDRGGVPTHPMGRNPGDVWSIATRPFSGSHFAVFPPDLPERCILAGSRPGDTVLDPFSGSGTTGMVATKHGRRYVGIDLNPEYHELALKTRLAQATLEYE